MASADATVRAASRVRRDQDWGIVLGNDRRALRSRRDGAHEALRVIGTGTRAGAHEAVCSWWWWTSSETERERRERFVGLGLGRAT